MKLLYFLCFLPVTLGDTPVTCIYSKDCLLPCESKHHDIIHWYKTGNDRPVHSYFEQNDNLDHQAPEFKGRTSLLPSGLLNGNTSLLLKDIRVEDEGRYKCYTADDKVNAETYVTMSVEAHAKSVDIALKDDTVTCSTNGVYPEPNISWTSSNSQENEPVNSFSQTEENLFIVTSQLKVDNNTKTYNYECRITSKRDPTKTLYSAILEQQENEDFTLKCPIPKDISYTLSFSYNTSILKYDSNTKKTHRDMQWKDKVNFHPENGNIILSHLNNEDLGTYTCDVTTTQKRHIIKFTVSSGGLGTGAIISIIIGIIVVVIVIAAVFFQRRKKKNPKNTGNNEHENEELKPENTNKVQ